VREIKCKRDGLSAIGRQLLEIAGAELAGEAGTTTIDLSNAAAPARSVNGMPRLVNRRRSKLPVLAAWPSADGRFLLGFCPWCQKWHQHARHGADADCGPGCPCPMHGGGHLTARQCLCPPGSGDGHRRAHCPGDTPFKTGGYVVREVRS
jgi:hypothetical protein